MSRFQEQILKALQRVKELNLKLTGQNEWTHEKPELEPGVLERISEKLGELNIEHKLHKSRIEIEEPIPKGAERHEIVHKEGRVILRRQH